MTPYSQIPQGHFKSADINRSFCWLQKSPLTGSCLCWCVRGSGWKEISSDGFKPSASNGYTSVLGFWQDMWRVYWFVIMMHGLLFMMTIFFFSPNLMMVQLLSENVKRRLRAARVRIRLLWIPPPPLHLSTSPPLHLSTSPPLHLSTSPPLHSIPTSTRPCSPVSSPLLLFAFLAALLFSATVVPLHYWCQTFICQVWW